MARDLAGEAAEEERRDTKSILGDHAEFCRGNEKAMPGYDSIYVPSLVPSPAGGGTYSPGNVGPISLW